MKLLWQIDTPVDPSLLSLMQAAADCALLTEGVNRPCAVSVRLCDDDAIHEKIIREENIANIVSFINELGLFRSAQENSIKSFKNNYCLEQVAVEEEPTNNDEISEDSNE